MTQTWPGRDEIAKRARRRWLWSMGVTFVGIAVSVPVVNSVLLTHSHSSTHQHYHPLAALLIGGVILLVSVGVLIWLVPKMWQGKGNFAPPLTAGLPRRQRREVTRALRRGRPSDDPTLAAVERETAQRIVRTARRGAAVFVFFIALEAVEAVTTSKVGAKIFFAAAALFFVAMFALQRWLARGARRYLASDAAAPIG